MRCIGNVGAQRGDDEGDGVACALVVLGPHRYRNAGGEGFVRQAAAVLQEAPQRPGAYRQHQVVEGAAGRAGQRAHAFKRELLGRKTPFFPHPAVERRTRRIKRHHHAFGRITHPLHHLAERQNQLRHGLHLATQRLHGMGRRVGKGGRRRVAFRRVPLALPGGPEGWRGKALGGVIRHRPLQQLHATDTVYQRVVHFYEEGESVTLQALDQGAFPWRTTQIERLALQPPDQLTEFAFAARPGQRGVAHVVLQVDVVVDDPGRYRVLGEGVLQAPVPRRGKLTVVAKVRHQAAHEVRGRADRQPERQQAADVIRRGTRFGE